MKPGDPDVTVSAGSDSGPPVSFAASGPWTVAGATVHLAGSLGVCTITASQTVESSLGGNTVVH